MTAEPAQPSTIRRERRLFSVAGLGPENPLPLVAAPPETPYRITGGVPHEIIDGSTYGNPATLFPYRAQDSYGRARTDQMLRTVVLENERLRAVFLPELGGRLWELFDKVAGKQLLHTQPDIQFANLALRNAWFAGGIEWNIGTRGHSPTTCSPMHAAIVHSPDGQDVLRMWEFERLREVVFQIDVWLPQDSPVLFAMVRIQNPNAQAVPMYWWTNAAVPENPDSRIVAPAESAFASDYSDGIRRVDPRDDGGIDCTWPTNNPRARDFFFDLAPEQRRWILNADRDGDGLAMLSTGQLRGRKLFVWGQGSGGRRWQNWLSPNSGPYAEIQAGLTQTQFQHLALPAGGEWSWLEAYGNARVDPGIAQGAKWDAAVAHCETQVDELVSAETLDATLDAARGRDDLAPGRPLLTGTGWGALEAERRRKNALPWIDETGVPFPAESIGDDQRPWWELLNGAGFQGAASFVTGPDWECLLEATRADSPDAAASLHRAVMRHAAGDPDAAGEHYREALRLVGSDASAATETADTESAFTASTFAASTFTASTQAEQADVIRAVAHRGLALLALSADSESAASVDEALEQYTLACAAAPGNVWLVIEAATAAIRIGAPDIALSVIGQANEGLTQNGRVRFLTALALARTDRRAEAAAILKSGLEVADLREGENSITALWQDVCPGEAVPPQYQFSMT